jgi:RecA-family ATPase
MDTIKPIRSEAVEKYLKEQEDKRRENNSDLIKDQLNKKASIKDNIKPIIIQDVNKFLPLEFICKRFKLTKGKLISFVAAGGSGKSLLLQYISVCIAGNVSLFNVIEINSGKVLHIDLEQSERLTNVRYSRISSGLNLNPLNVIKNIDRIFLPRIDIQSNLIEIENQFVDLCKGYSVVIIDSLKKLSNADENSSEIEYIVNMLKHTAERANILILLIHHTGKSKIDARQTGRGHSSIYDSVDMQIDIEHEATDITGTVVLSCAKNRDGAVFSGIKFRFYDDGEYIQDQDCFQYLKFELLSNDFTPQEKKEEKRNASKVLILRALQDGEINQGQLYDKVKGDRNIFDKIVENCLLDKLITERRGKSNARLFSLTERGNGALAICGGDNA